MGLDRYAPTFGWKNPKVVGDPQTTGVAFEPMDFVSKLAALIPRPRMNVIRFHGVYAPHARLRESVIPEPEELPEKSGCGCGPDDPASRNIRLQWAELLSRVFQVDVFRCPRCHSKMQRIAWITDPATIRKILNAVGRSADLPTGPPHQPNTEPFENGPVNLNSPGIRGFSTPKSGTDAGKTPFSGPNSPTRGPKIGLTIAHRQQRRSRRCTHRGIPIKVSAKSWLYDSYPRVAGANRRGAFETSSCLWLGTK